MTLEKYLAENGIKKKDFADRLGVGKAAVTKWCKGQTFPTRDALEKITKATGGSVTANDFMSTAA